MTSDKQGAANRRNALKSTGPKTPEGKAAVRLNAMKHGLLSKDVLLPGEDESALKELGGASGFTVDATEDAGAFTSGNLRRYDALVEGLRAAPTAPGRPRRTRA